MYHTMVQHCLPLMLVLATHDAWVVWVKAETQTLQSVKSLYQSTESLYQSTALLVLPKAEVAENWFIPFAP